MANLTAPMRKKKENNRHRGVFEKVPGSGVWWVRYFDADGKKRREKVGRKSDAIALYQRRKADARAGIKLPANMRYRGEKVATIIDRAIEWYKQHRPKSLRTAQTHLEAAKDYLGHHLAESLTPAHVDNWISSHDDWTPATKNRYKATLGRALQLAVVDGRLDRNVARLVSARKEDNQRIRWLLADEEERLTKAILKEWPEYIQSFRIALHTGMRQSEQYTLEWSDVDFQRRKIFIDKTKTGYDREVPMNQTCLSAFKELKARAPEGVSWVFLSARYSKERLLNPRQWFDAVVKTAKVHNFRWHDCRHTFISRLVMKGVPLSTVQQLAGHRSITMTARYSHLAPEHLKGAVEMLDAE